MADSPLTPARMRRIFRLDDLLGTMRTFRSAELQADLKVSERTIVRDIKELRKMGGPIPEQDPRGYFYLHRFRLPRFLQLSEGELLAFYVADRIVEGFGPDNPYAVKLKRGIRQLSKLLARKMPVEIEHLMHRGFHFDAGPVREVLPAVLETVEVGLRDLVPVEITYRTLSRGGAISTRVVEPYLLHNYRGDWYLVARCRHRQEPVNFAVSRISHARVLRGESFEVPKAFDPRDFFQSTFGVYRGQEPQPCRIWFSPRAALWIRERRWHATQSVEERRDGSIVLAMTVTPTPEVVRWILAHGPEARALQPECLAAEVRRQIEAAHANLDSPDLSS